MLFHYLRFIEEKNFFSKKVMNYRTVFTCPTTNYPTNYFELLIEEIIRVLIFLYKV